MTIEELVNRLEVREIRLKTLNILIHSNIPVNYRYDKKINSYIWGIFKKIKQKTLIPTFSLNYSNTKISKRVVLGYVMPKKNSIEIYTPSKEFLKGFFGSKKADIEHYIINGHEEAHVLQLLRKYDTLADYIENAVGPNEISKSIRKNKENIDPRFEIYSQEIEREADAAGMSCALLYFSEHTLRKYLNKSEISVLNILLNH